MSLRDAAERIEQAATCKVIDFLKGLDKADTTTLTGWIADRKPAGWISRVITADGRNLNEKTLKRHLDGLCHCPDGTDHKGAYRVAK